MKKMINSAVFTAAVITLNGCSSLAYPLGPEPRSPERQQISDACWGYGKDNTGVYLATLLFKPVVCVANDVAQGQAQASTGGFRSTTVITPQGTYRVITSPGITTIDKTAR